MPTTLELDTDYHNAQRFPIWMALAVFSAVCLAAVTSQSDNDRGADVKWVLAVCSISMVLSIVAIFMYLLMRAIFVGQVFEAGMISLLIAFWGAGLPVIMNPNNDIAVRNIEVVNANLYFFAWLSFAACLALSASLLNEISGVDLRQTDAKSAKWYGLTASSLVVMGSSIRIFVANDCKSDELTSVPLCRRTKLGIALGVIGFVLSALLTYLSQLGLAIVYELAATVLLLTLWCFGVGYVTFGDSPGSRIGNLYFAVWICFILTVVLFGQCFRDLVHARNATSEQQQEQQQQQEDSYGESQTPHSQPSVPDEEDF